MWIKIKEQLPAALLTAFVTVVILVAFTFWFRKEVVAELTANQQKEMAALREQTDAKMKETSDQLRAQNDATYALLKDSVENRRGELFMSDEELTTLNDEKVNMLAQALSERIQPYGVPIPKDPQEAEELRNRQVDEVAGRMAGRIQPILEEMSKNTDLTRESVTEYSQRISDQISTVLTSELAAKQQLNNNLLETQAIAHDSMRVAQEITALYLTQMKDESVFARILTLPARVIQDTAKGSIVNSNERQKAEERLAIEMKDLEERLNAVNLNMPSRETPTRPQG
ncbi:MAG TPA: hypothetical protein VMM36_04490 [Opitutaceae bacterium]|nr:hypothetical protein [Opitutaceae bacterium]